jgi:Cysteine-rich CPXCG
VEDSQTVRCPYCREYVSVYIDPDNTGVMIEDCEVCCKPWQLEIDRSGGKLKVRVSRAQ